MQSPKETRMYAKNLVDGVQEKFTSIIYNESKFV